jgi:hypothetical protein
MKSATMQEMDNITQDVLDNAREKLYEQMRLNVKFMFLTFLLVLSISMNIKQYWDFGLGIKGLNSTQVQMLEILIDYGRPSYLKQYECNYKDVPCKQSL